MNMHSKALASVFAAVLLTACGGGKDASSSLQPLAAEGRSAALSANLLTAPATARIDPRLRRTSGLVEVWVALDQDSMARARAVLAARTGIPRVRALSSSQGEGRARVESAAIASAMAVQRVNLLAQQSAMSATLRGLGATEHARVRVASNAIAITVDAARLPDIARLPGVVSVRPVLHYEMHLSETVPYIGAAAAQAAGTDGAGVTVAVLDSGIDYTHKNLGGAGTLAAYAAAYGTSPADPKNTTTDDLFPTSKVVGGFDFVGETWGRVNNVEVGVRTEDPDPIDLQGHGTHVADIVAGQSVDGTHKGVAPGAKLVAVKVCSAISGACNGIALLKGMDFALDPNGDLDTSDAVDIINMSLGSSYGQIEDDLSGATATAVALGVTVVVSAGNSADRPYITGSPSSTPGALSVAQTQVPSAKVFPLTVTGINPSVINNIALVDWAPLGAGFNGSVVRVGRGCPAGSGDDPYFNGNNPSGKVALIDRGACSISLKVDRATKAGAVAVLLANNAAGDPPSFSFGGGDPPLVPMIVITQADGNRIKTALGATGMNAGVVASASPAAAVALVGSMVASSSRGPNINFGHIKPEIGAPGASLSAEAGTGNGQTVFGGTSGAAPMVAGSAALVLSKNPTFTPMQVKAMLMNSAETNVFINPATQAGVLAPITRIGSGEVRVDRALAQKTLAWDPTTLSAALSFGSLEADRQITVSRTLTVQNLEATAKQFQVASSFRYADDAASKAVTVQAPTVLNVPAGGSASLTVTLLINPTLLPEWTLNGGARGGDGFRLNGPEYDGYLTLTAGAEKMSVPWHVLPRKAAALVAGPFAPGRGGNNLTLLNGGAELGIYDMFSLVGRSPQLQGPLPGPGDNIAVVDLKSVGVRYLPGNVCGVEGGCVEFATSVWTRNAHPLYPRGIEIEVDTTGDGVPDFFVYQQEATGFAATGQSVAFVQRRGSSTLDAFFFNDADLNSGNVIYTIPLLLLGPEPNVALSPGTTLNFNAVALDNYFTGVVTDVITNMRFTPATPRFGSPTLPFGSIARGASARVPFTSVAVPNTASSEQGILMMYRRNAGNESQEFALPVVPVPSGGN